MARRRQLDPVVISFLQSLFNDPNTINTQRGEFGGGEVPNLQALQNMLGPFGPTVLPDTRSGFGRAASGAMQRAALGNLQRLGEVPIPVVRNLGYQQSKQGSAPFVGGGSFSNPFLS